MQVPLPGGFKIDDSLTDIDSSKFSGIVYEKMEQADQFNGEHSILFIDSAARSFKESFSFAAVSLVNDVPHILHHKTFILELKNFNAAKTKLRLVLTDTSFASPDVNELLPVTNGKVTISERMLSQLVNGPITLELFEEEQRPLSDSFGPPGRITISYNLSRLFILEN